MEMCLPVWKEEQSTTETIVPLKKGFPFVISFVANPGPLGQSSSYSGVFFTGHSSHSSVPQAAPTEQQQASMRWRPEMGRVHSSSSYLRKQVSTRLSAREQREAEESNSGSTTQDCQCWVRQSIVHSMICYILTDKDYFVLKRNPGFVMGIPA